MYWYLTVCSYRYEEPYPPPPPQGPTLYLSGTWLNLPDINLSNKKYINIYLLD